MDVTYVSTALARKVTWQVSEDYTYSDQRRIELSLKKCSRVIGIFCFLTIKTAEGKWWSGSASG